MNWDEWTNLFSKAANLFDRPIILFIDEFDSLPRGIIDILVSLFRNIYLKRENYLLHGLALIGVRAVLGLESQRGSPFNIQRSLHVPNLTPDEVTEMFGQYQQESGQNIEAAVTDKIYEVTRGQPGLVSWLGELLTETFNPGKDLSQSLYHRMEQYCPESDKKSKGRISDSCIRTLRALGYSVHDLGGLVQLSVSERNY